MKTIAWLTALILCVVGVARGDDAVVFTIDAQRDRKPISRYIYGINGHVDQAHANLTIARSGGNRLTAYNWVNNASNAGSDWQFQNDNFLGGDDKPGGALAPLIESTFKNHAALILTIPLNDHVAADKNGGGDVRNSGADYLNTRFRRNRPKKNGAFTLTPDPASDVFQDEFVRWLKTRYPQCEDAATPVFFCMDNEPALWASTHKEIHPDKTTYAEMVEKTVAFAGAIKDVMPKTKILGPVSYGWQGYVNLQDAPDAGGRDFLEFYLDAMKQAEKTRGRRLLDVLDVHWYPEAQGNGKRVTTQDNDEAVAAARLSAPRSLWDPDYTEKSWITQWSTKGPIALLPRLRKKIETQYPGTQLSMTEYNYGGGAHISGAIAEADVLGIFGQQGLFAACLWPLSDKEPFIHGGMKMYRNFDGHNATFGDTSVYAQTSDIEKTSIYASIDSSKKPERLVLIALNKTGDPITAQVKLDHAPGYKTARAFHLTQENPDPVPTDAPAAAPQFNLKLPAYSVTTVEFSK